MNKIVETLESNISTVKNKKPLAYFDQNILDMFYKHIPEEHSVSNLFTEDFQVVYSDITLAEIHKAGVNGKNLKYTNNFLDVLTRLNAQHISLMMEDGRIINNIYRSFQSPAAHYKLFLENIEYDEFILPMQKTSLALFGGVNDYEALKAEQKKVMQDLQTYLKAQIELLKEGGNKNSDIEFFIKSYESKIIELDSQVEGFNESVDKSLDNIRNYTAEKSGHQALREYLNIDINILKNIGPPNTLDNILEYLRRINEENEVSIDLIFNFDNSHISLDRELYIFEKVNKIYALLNLIGYHEDEKLHKEDKHFRSLRDMHHASYACFCEYFFTNDQRLIRKTQATYEYLSIATQICKVNLDYK